MRRRHIPRQSLGKQLLQTDFPLLGSTICKADFNSLRPKPTTTSVPSPPFSDPTINSERLGPVIRDESGQRVDKPLDVDPSGVYVQVLRNTNLCMWYYLRGECSGCERVHDVKPLNPHGYDCLWFVARQGMCFKVRNGKDCDDAKCIYGHRQL